MRPRKSYVAIALCACLGAALLWGSLASAGRNQYYVDAVTIKVDRGARIISGKVVADSFDEHFCTNSGQWPVSVRRVMPGKDRKLTFGMQTNFRGEWRFRVRSATLRGKRVYAEVPDFPNQANGYCNGARSRTVRAP
jgi:hypothetical protein